MKLDALRHRLREGRPEAAPSPVAPPRAAPRGSLVPQRWFIDIDGSRFECEGMRTIGVDRAVPVMDSLAPMGASHTEVEVTVLGSWHSPKGVGESHLIVVYPEPDGEPVVSSAALLLESSITMETMSIRRTKLKWRLIHEAG